MRDTAVSSLWGHSLGVCVVGYCGHMNMVSRGVLLPVCMMGGRGWGSLQPVQPRKMIYHAAVSFRIVLN